MVEQGLEKLVSDLLSEIAKAVRGGDANRIRQLHALAFAKNSRARTPATAKRVPQAVLPLHEVERFVDFPSRESLEQHIKATYATKADVERAARQLKVATIKTDTYERLMQRIVDATVGYRLRAEAIRGREKTALP